MGAGWLPAHGSRAPVRVQTKHQPLAPPWLAFQAIIYQHVAHCCQNAVRVAASFAPYVRETPQKSSQGISPTTFSSTPKSNGFYCFLRSLQVLAVTSEGFGSRFQLAARYRMLSVPLEVLLNRAGGCSFLCLPSPCLLGRISSHPKQAWLPLFPKSLAS